MKMAPVPTPPSATSSNGHFTPDGQYRVVRRRNRIPLSCAPCRTRKLKCNRQQPCDNCTKRGDVTSCSYATPGARKKQSNTSSSGSSPVDMQQRVERLESLLLSFATNGPQALGPAAAQRALSMSTENTSSNEYTPDNEVDMTGNSEGNNMRRSMGVDESETEQVAESLGVMKVDNGKAMYWGDSHWSTIMGEFQELKTYFTEHEKQLKEQYAKVEALQKRADPNMENRISLLGGSGGPTFEQLLAKRPGKDIADKLIGRYFNSYDPAVHILHHPSWYRTYMRQWEDPVGVGAPWLAQFFAVLSLAMHSYHTIDDEPPEFRGKSLHLAGEYRSLAAQTLQSHDFLMPVPNIVEALILYVHSEYARRRDVDIGIWLLDGIIVRLALRMGYHRDPKHYPNISPFAGEIRRRVWTFIRQTDLLFSFQLGLQCMIRTGDYDTELPHNVYDEEFKEDSTKIPDSRPISEITEISYMITKARISFAFAKVVEHLQAVKSSTYEDVERLDNELEGARRQVPPLLRMQSMDDSKMDPGALVMQRINLAVLYNKAQCVLHRKFLCRARENPRYANSRNQCVDASLELLRLQRLMHDEAGPGKKLYRMTIFASSLSSYDFLLAAVLVSLDMSDSLRMDSSRERPKSVSSSSDAMTLDDPLWQERMQVLIDSRDIWMEQRDQTMEAFKATEILGVILKKLETARNNPGQQNSFPFPAFGPGIDTSIPSTYNAQSQQPQRSTINMEEKPEHSAAMTLGMLSHGGIGNASQMYGGAGAQYASLSGIGSVDAGLDPQLAGVGQGLSPGGLSTFAADGGMNIDWDAWDNYIQNTTAFNFPLTPGGSQTSGQQQQQPITTTTTTSSNDPLFSLNAAASAALQTPQQQLQQGKSSNPYSWTPATNASYSSPQYDMNGLTQPSINAGGAGAGAPAGLGSTAYHQQQQQRMAPQAQMQAIAQQASGNMGGLDGFGNGNGEGAS